MKLGDRDQLSPTEIFSAHLQKILIFVGSHLGVRLNRSKRARPSYQPEGDSLKMKAAVIQPTVMQTNILQKRLPSFLGTL
jgi:hypothetical protein